eukprot:scaffold41479_cov58-Phaeocystis_antarctica.AAC.2
MPNRPKMGVRIQIFGSRTELFARAHGASRLAAALRRLRKFHTKCVPSHLILRTKNSGSEESLAVDARHDFAAYVIFPRAPQHAPLSDHLASTPHFGAPPLIYHPCQCRASAAAPGVLLYGIANPKTAMLK